MSCISARDILPPTYHGYLCGCDFVRGLALDDLLMNLDCVMECPHLSTEQRQTYSCTIRAAIKNIDERLAANLTHKYGLVPREQSMTLTPEDEVRTFAAKKEIEDRSWLRREAATRRIDEIAREAEHGRMMERIRTHADLEILKDAFKTAIEEQRREENNRQRAQQLAALKSLSDE